jgi:hypothetical protein
MGVSLTEPWAEAVNTLTAIVTDWLVRPRIYPRGRLAVVRTMTETGGA